MKVRVFSCQLLCFIPDQLRHALLRCPVEFDKDSFIFSINQPESMHAKTLHGTQAAWNCPVGHGPHHRMGRFRNQRHEVPEGIVGRSTGWYFSLLFRLHGMYKVWKLDTVLNKKYRSIICDQIIIAFISIKLGGKTTNITYGIRGATWPLHRRKTYKNWCLYVSTGQKSGLSPFVIAGISFKKTVRSNTTCMHNPLRDTLMVEMGDFLTQ